MDWEDLATSAICIGIAATALTDIWAFGLRHVFGIPSMNWGLVGRWIALMPKGHFIHENITGASSVPWEKVVGWIAHYLTGIAFAAALLAICGASWARQPTLAPALLFGISTVAAPFFLMQPSLGFGVAAAKTPQPTAMRLRSLVTHVVFGFGLYVAAWIQSALLRA